MNELDVNELLDRATLAADARWPGASVTDLEALHGGVSSLTFTARLTGGDGEARPVVVKVAPPGLPPVRNRDVLRQARVLHALTGAEGVKVPRVLLEDAGSPPFFIMSFVAGEAYDPKKDVSDSPPAPDVVDRRARAAARMLARLHQVKPSAVGLADEPVTSPSQELDRWARLFATVEDDLHHDEARLHRLLAGAIPTENAPRILHGDFRMGNMQYAGDDLAAIIDWEIWSIGDPRADLAWLMAYTDPVLTFVEERDPANLAASDAVPDKREILTEYLALRPIDTRELDWFLACCYYKIASTTAALAKRNRRRSDPDAGLLVAEAWLGPVIERGLEILSGVSRHRR